MQPRRRRRVFVDPTIQGALCLRVVIYWICFLVSTALLLGCWLGLRAPPSSFSQWFTDIWTRYGPALAVASLIFPIVVLDLLVVSNKFAGPLRRLHAAMKRLGDGEHVEPIRFRSNDFCGEFAEEFNRILGRMNSLERAVAAPENSKVPRFSDNALGDFVIRATGLRGSANGEPRANGTRSPEEQR